MLKILMGALVMLIAQSSLYAGTTPTLENTTKLYVATFNRAPDAAGLNYWANNAGLSLEGIAQSFFDQSETQKAYPADSTNTDFIKAVYQNLFNRAAEADGLVYWVEELDSGRIAKSTFILAVINGAQDTEEFGNDATILTNKTRVGLSFANAGLNDITDAREIMLDVTDDPSSTNSAFLDGQSSDPSCNFQYETIMGMKISNPTCTQKWNLWNFLTLGSTILRNDFMVLYANQEGVMDTNEARSRFISLAESTIDVLNIGGAISTKASEEVVNAISSAIVSNMTRYIPSDSVSLTVLLNTQNLINDSILAAAAGVQNPWLFAINAAPGAMDTFFTFIDAFKLNSIVENLNEINIAQEYLYRYYQFGGDTLVTDKHFTGSEYNSWENIIDAVAATMSLSNKGWGEDYDYTKVLEIINYYKDEFIPEITNSTMNVNSDDRSLLDGKILREDDKWQAEIKIDTLIANQKSASIDFKALNCGGDLLYSYQEDGGYLFQETITYGSCVQNCQIWIKADGSEYKEFCNGSLAGYGNLHEVSVVDNSLLADGENQYGYFGENVIFGSTLATGIWISKVVENYGNSLGGGEYEVYSNGTILGINGELEFWGISNNGTIWFGYNETLSIIDTLGDDCYTVDGVSDGYNFIGELCRIGNL